MILHVITGLGQGGAETALYRLVGGSDAPDRHHIVSLSGEGIFAPRLRELGAEVTCLDFSRPDRALGAFFALYRLIRRLRPRVTQTWMYHADLIGGAASRLAGTPVCWGVRHSNLDPAANKRSTLFTARLCAWFSSWVPTRIVSCSERAIDAHRKFGYAARFTFIPNGVELSAYREDRSKRVRVRESLDVRPDVKIVGHVGRFHAQKDYPTLFRAFALLAPQGSVRLVLAGTGLDGGNAAFRDLALAAGDGVLALGSRNDVPDLLQAMDVFVLSSIGEGFPNVVAEAMASGVPCVVTDVGDAATIVGTTGWIVPASDPEALAHALGEALAEEPTSMALRSTAARDRISNHFTIQKMVQAYEAVWTEAQGS